MELNQFIKTALADVTNAVKESRRSLSNGCVICPNQVTQLIEFDIAVTVGSSMSAEAKAGTDNFIGKIIAIGGKAEGEHGHSQLPRIKFEVPILFPPGSVVEERNRSVVRNARPKED